MKKLLLLSILIIMGMLSYGCTETEQPSDDETPIIDDENDVDETPDEDDNGGDSEGKDDIDNDKDEPIDDDNDEDDVTLFPIKETFPVNKELYTPTQPDQYLGYLPSALELHFQNNSEIPYIDIELLIDVFSTLYFNGSFESSVDKDIIIIEHHVDHNSTLIDDVTYTLTIDLNTSVVTYSHRQFGQYELFPAYDPSFYEYTHFELIEGTPFSIDLTTYDYEPVIEDDIIYIPFELGNILFGSNWVFLYYNAKEIFIQPTTNFSAVIRNTDLADTRLSDELMHQTLQHMRILFNYFHGVHEYGDGEDFEHFIRHYRTRFLFAPDHYRMIYANLARLDDLHTSYMINGSYSPFLTIPPSSDFMRSDRTQAFNNALKEAQELNLCYSGLRYKKLNETIAVIEISNITEQTPNQFKEALDQAKEDNIEDVIIDLSCNTGGSLLHTLEIMALITEQPLSLVIRDSADHSVRNITYQSTVDTTYDFNYYVLTSTITYSAGNYLSYLLYEYLDAPLIGLPTSGGASSIRFVSVPSGSLFSMSSTTQLRTKDNESLEFGINVDIDLSLIDLKNNEILIDTIASIKTTLED